MKHISSISRTESIPRKAESLLVTQQKVAIFGAFAAALGALGESIAIFLGLPGGE